MKYCCIDMEKADNIEIIDYCPNHITTIESKEPYCYPINYCPFCGKNLVKTKETLETLKKIKASAPITNQLHRGGL